MASLRKRRKIKMIELNFEQPLTPIRERKNLVELRVNINDCDATKTSVARQSTAANEQVSNHHQSQSQSSPHTYCLICSKEIESGSGSGVSTSASVNMDGSSTVTLLFQLFKILKISPAICRFILEVDTLPTLLYCDPCQGIISSCLKSTQEIEHLQNVVESLSSQIKENVIEGYYCRPEATQHAHIRKTLVQCWTTCQVKIKKLDSSNKDMSKHRVSKTKSDFQLMEPVKLETIFESYSQVYTINRETKAGAENLLHLNDPFNSPSPVDSGADYQCVSSPDNFDDGENHGLLSPCPDPPASLSDASNDGKTNSTSIDLQEFTDATTVTSGGRQISQGTDADTFVVEHGINSNSGRSLRPRKQKPILKYDSDSDEIEIENDTGSVYSPGPESPTQEVRIEDSNNKRLRRNPRINKSKNSQPSPLKLSLAELSRRKRNRNRTGVLHVGSERRWKEFPFNCKTCGKGYHHKHRLVLHEKHHMDEEKLKLKFTCMICQGQEEEVSFLSAYQLDMHMFQSHETEPRRFPKKPAVKKSLESFRCTYCDTVYHRDDFRLRVGPGADSHSTGTSASTTNTNDRFKIKCDQPGCEKTFSNFSIFSYHHVRTCLKKLCSEEHKQDDNGNGDGNSMETKTLKEAIVKTFCTEFIIPSVSKPKNTNLFQCKVPGCSSRGFPRKYTLKLHEIQRHGEHGVSCPECDLKFPIVNSARVHQIRVHGKPEKAEYDPGGNLELFQCVYCHNEFRRKNYLVHDTGTGTDADADVGGSSKETERLEIPYYSNSGNTKKIFSDFKEFHWYHRRNCGCRPKITVSDGRLEGNDRLLVSMTKQGKLPRSFKSGSRTYRYRCGLCNKGYQLLSHFENHQKHHRGELQHPCPECGKAFLGAPELKLHCTLTSHSLDKTLSETYCHTCTSCEKTYNIKYETRPDGIRSLNCVFEGCERWTTTMNGHRKHHGTHHKLDNSTMKCDRGSCSGREFNYFSSSHLNEAGDRVITCDFDFGDSTCNQDFKRFSVFWNHHLRHHGDGKDKEAERKRFRDAHSLTCKFCQKVFKHPNSCKNHIKAKHLKEFKFYCDICGIGRPCLSKLKQHVLTHSTEKAYKCELCPRVFKVAYELKSHMNLHNNIRAYICELCGRSYHSSNTLGMHKKQSHKIKK